MATAAPTTAPTSAAVIAQTASPLFAPSNMLSEGDIISLLPTPEVETTLSPKITFPDNLCVIISRQVWMKTRQLAMLAIRNGVPRLEKFRFQDPAQVWALSPNGSVRVLAGSGLYLGVDEQCVTPVSSPQFTRATMWTAQPSGSHQFQFQLMAQCNKPLGADRDALTLNASRAMSEWFIVPVAKVVN